MAAKKGKKKINLQDLKPKEDPKGGVTVLGPTGHRPGGNPPTSHGPQTNRFFGP